MGKLRHRTIKSKTTELQHQTAFVIMTCLKDVVSLGGGSPPLPKLTWVSASQQVCPASWPPPSNCVCL